VLIAAHEKKGAGDSDIGVADIRGQPHNHELRLPRSRSYVRGPAAERSCVSRTARSSDESAPR